MPTAVNLKLHYFLFLLVAIALVMNGVVAQAAKYVAFDVKHSSGNFGGDLDNSVSSLNFSAGVTTYTYDADVTVPFVNLKTEGSDAESGIGDIVVRGGHQLLSNQNKDLLLYGSLAAKLATADENAGLGTGENDYGIYLNLYKYWGQHGFSVYSGYRVNGDPAGIDLKDVFSYGAGWSMYHTKTSFYLSLEGQQTAISGLEDPLMFHTGMYHILSPLYMLRGEVLVGLSNSSADYGVSFGIVRVF
ncbi:MAG: hypothetical protein PVJ72_15015 [Gammaproteobacteria bacterium]|jgi:hypothetical protein